MELFKPMVAIYNLVGRMKKNNEQCPHIEERLRALGDLVLFISQMEQEQLSDNVKKALEKFGQVLSSADELVKKFNKAHMLNQAVKSSDYKLEFDSLNKSLSDAFVILSGALHAFQGKRLMEQESKLMEQDARIDEQECELIKQEKRIEEQENKQYELQKKLARQERTLTEQEELLRSLQSKYESRWYYCVLL